MGVYWSAPMPDCQCKIAFHPHLAGSCIWSGAVPERRGSVFFAPKTPCPRKEKPAPLQRGFRMLAGI